MGMAAMASATISGSSAAVAAPGLTERCTKRSPLASLTRSSAVHSTPCLAAKPSSARVGLPSPSRATFTYGPSTSARCSGCSVATFGSSTARRRGVYSGRASPASKAMPRLARAAVTPSKKARARPGRALTGSSSVPSSISRGRICASMENVRSVRGGALEAREAELLALRVVGAGHRLRQGAHPQDVALALGDADGAAGVQQVEGVAGLAHLLVGRQRQLRLHQPQRLGLAGVEAVEQLGHVGVLEVVGALLDLVLVVHVAVGHRALRTDGPDQVVDVVHVLQVHAQALEAVGDLAEHRPALQAAGLLEVGELGHLHAVEPDLPAQ